MRRLQKKLGKELNKKQQDITHLNRENLDKELLKGQSRRAHFITIIILPLFSYVYNSYFLG